jgi:16S rRNA (guanine966-N2)-methyltransferase
MRRTTRTVTVGGGEWRGRVLRYPGDDVLRPTMQRTKQSLFSSLGGRLSGAVFVDCFAGAGAVGIEALSRGAARAHFIEERGDAVDALRANLALCGAPRSRYDVHHARVADVFARVPNPLAVATIMFADPPYDVDLDAEFLSALRPGRFAALEVVVIERRTKQAVFAPAGWRVDRERRFGETTLSYLAREA